MSEHAKINMELTFLGTGSAYPCPKRGASSMAVKYGQDVWIFDCGEGTQVKLMESDLKPGKISKIFITHLHGDHCFGLPGLLCTMSQSNQRTEPVSIYGPVGLAKFLRVTLSLSRSALTTYRYRVYELVPTDDMYQADDGELCNQSPDDCPVLHPAELPGGLIKCNADSIWLLEENDSITISAGKLVHRIPSFAFILCESDKMVSGKLDVNKLISLGGTAGPACNLLKSGQSVTLDDGTVIKPGDVCGPSTLRPGRKVVICGDSSDSTGIAKLAQNADIFVHEATVQNSMVDLAVDRGHSTPKMAAEYAILASAQRLIITHFSQRYNHSTKKKSTEPGVDLLLAEAKQVFGESVKAADDFLTIDIPTKTC